MYHDIDNFSNYNSTIHTNYKNNVNTDYSQFQNNLESNSN